MKSPPLPLSVDDIPNLLGVAVVTEEGSPLIGRARYVVASPLFAWMRQPSHDARVVSGSGATPTTHINTTTREGSAEQLKKDELNSWKETSRASVVYDERRFYGVFGAVRESATPGVCPQTRMNHGSG